MCRKLCPRRLRRVERPQIIEVDCTRFGFRGGKVEDERRDRRDRAVGVRNMANEPT